MRDLWGMRVGVIWKDNDKTSQSAFSSQVFSSQSEGETSATEATDAKSLSSKRSRVGNDLVKLPRIRAICKLSVHFRLKLGKKKPTQSTLSFRSWPSHALPRPKFHPETNILPRHVTTCPIQPCLLKHPLNTSASGEAIHAPKKVAGPENSISKTARNFVSVATNKP